MLEIALGYGPLDQDPGPEGAIRIRAAPIGQNDRQSDLALAEVVADMLAQLGRAAAVVERIIDQLKSEAEIAAVGAERRPGGAVASADRGADFGRGGKERRGLGADHREVLVLGGRSVLCGGKLHHFAFRNHRGRMGEDVEGIERADLDHHLEGLAEEEVADQHARLVAPDHAGGELAAAELALVDDVVVEEGGGVHELDARRELDMALAVVTAHLGRSDGEHRPSRLPPEAIR